ncbi:MAG: serine/threonine protein kinase [Myxococcales bacterium]|nr:serine/threonine protein kinase [Myxococcales bacterium]
MASNDDHDGTLRAARPAAGDLVDRMLAGKLRAALFGAPAELQLGRLRIEGSLGRGAMGAILSAFDPVLDRHVAVKSLHPDHRDDRDQLLREARMLAKLSHANVVAIYDVVEDADGLYLVMEQLDGGDLRAWLEQPRTWREIVALFIQIGHGLAAAHALGIAHCDVKPENIVVADGRPRLIDFGLARRRTDAPSSAGTRAYLAPERVAGGGGSAAADQYAFFASLVEAIEGQRPGDGARWARTPAWLERVARRGLEPDPARRFPDMTAAVAALAPTPLRTKVVIGVAVATVAGLTAVVLTQRARAAAAREVCQGAEAQVASVWTEAGRATAAAAFTATGVADADAVWAQVDARLDRYVADWVRLRTASCKATRVHHDQSADVLDLSMRCFDRQLAALTSVTTLFADPNPTVVQRAVRTVGELGDLDACVDPVALTRAVPLPTGDAARAQLRALEARFDAQQHLERRGQHQEALAASDGLVDDVRALGYAPLTARVLLLRAALQVTLGDPGAAEQTFRAAASAAAQAQDDAKVAEVWIRVLDLLAQQGRLDDALTLEPVAVTSAERVPDELAIQGRLYNTLGGIYLAKARYPDAYRAYERALALQRQLGADGNPALTPALANLGLARWYAGDPRGALRDLQEALERMQVELGPDHSSVAYVHQNLADIYRQLGDGDQAAPHYQEVIRIWQQSLGAEHPNLAYPYEQLALLASRRGDFATARADVDLALGLRERGLGPDHPLVPQTLTVVAEIGLAEDTPASRARATHAVARAMTTLTALGEAGKRQIVYTLESRAQLAERRRDHKAALRDRQAALAIRIDTLGADHPDTGMSHAHVAASWLALGDLAQADRSLARALAIYDAHPGVHDADAIALRVTRGDLAARQHRDADATALYQQALAHLDPTDPRAAPIRARLE